MCGHIKKQEVLLLCGEDTFLHQVFGQAFSDISQLIVQLERIPGLAYVTTLRSAFRRNKINDVHAEVIFPL